MKGYVPTPDATVDAIVGRLFRDRAPERGDTLLDPGCGTGAFIDGVIRWCNARGLGVPRITGVELDPRHMEILRAKYDRRSDVQIECRDFLTVEHGPFDFIVGNPPYVAITALSPDEKARYRAQFSTARGRFDLYLLFFEQAMRSLAPGGLLGFITPEKYLYVDTAGPLRALLARHAVEEIRLVSEDTFGPLVTYPTVTVVRKAAPGRTLIVRRGGSRRTVRLPDGTHSWLPLLERSPNIAAGPTLGDLCHRISCGVATGADGVFVRSHKDLERGLEDFAYPTIAGRQLDPSTTRLVRRSTMLIPYDRDGRLLPLRRLGALRRYLERDDVRARLVRRTCVTRKPWYAFHETPVLSQILRPKILCKDICESPCFWPDRRGDIVPRHSVYYLVPRDPAALDQILEFLRSPFVAEWLARNCQRASKGFLRLQSRVLRRIPVPDDVAEAATPDGRPLRATMPSRQTELVFAGSSA